MSTLREDYKELLNNHNTLESEVMGIKHTLEGNGAIGLYDQLKAIRQEQKEVRNHQKAISNDFVLLKKQMLYSFLTFIIITSSSLIGNNADFFKFVLELFIK